MADGIDGDMDQSSDFAGPPTGASDSGEIVQGGGAGPFAFGHADMAAQPPRKRGGAGSLAMLPILVAIVAGMVGLPIQFERINLDSGLAGAWAIPARGELESVTGVLQAPTRILVHHRRSADTDWSIGNLVTEDGQVFSYSCNPGGDHLECLDPIGQAQGHRVTISYFYMPRWLFPAYQFVDPDTHAASQVDRKAAAIAMEATDQGSGQTLLAYDDSVQRLKAYQGAHPPHFAPMIDAARRLVGLPPTPTPVVAVGRGQDDAEVMAQGAAASAKATHGVIDMVGDAMAIFGFLMIITWGLAVAPGLQTGQLRVRPSRYSREIKVIDRATDPQAFWTRIAVSGGSAVFVCVLLVSFAVWTWRL
jgi:hypothetical protein